jgi:poly(3-hydroxybutyrate) depolymerase
VAVLSIMASADTTIPLRGGPFADSVLADAKDSIKLWSEVNQCTSASTSALENILDVGDVDPGTSYERASSASRC